MTRKSKVVIIVGVLVIGALVCSVWWSIRHSEIEVQRRIAAVEIGMTEAEVRKVCGEPSYTMSGGWLGSDTAYDYSLVTGLQLKYSYPYWWDYAIWRVWKNPRHLDREEMLREKARNCVIVLEPQDGENRVIWVGSKAAYSGEWKVVKGKDE